MNVSVPTIQLSHDDSRWIEWPSLPHSLETRDGCDDSPKWDKIWSDLSDLVESNSEFKKINDQLGASVLIHLEWENGTSYL